MYEKVGICPEYTASNVLVDVYGQYQLSIMLSPQQLMFSQPWNWCAFARPLSGSPISAILSRKLLPTHR